MPRENRQMRQIKLFVQESVLAEMDTTGEARSDWLRAAINEKLEREHNGKATENTPGSTVDPETCALRLGIP